MVRVTRAHGAHLDGDKLLHEGAMQQQHWPSTCHRCVLRHDHAMAVQFGAILILDPRLERLEFGSAVEAGPMATRPRVTD
jgi:hypothetical protein